MSNLSLKQLIVFDLVYILVNIMMTYLPMYLPINLLPAGQYVALLHGVGSGAED